MMDLLKPVVVTVENTLDGVSLNPCYDGSSKARKQTQSRRRSNTVLILVMMDLLKPELDWKSYRKGAVVLILVMMDLLKPEGKKNP